MKPRRILFPMSPLLRGNLSLAVTIALSLGGSHVAFAANQTWNGVAADGNWLTATNWAGGAVPGATTGTTNDVATFNIALNGIIGGVASPIIIDPGRRIGGITFDTANAGAYVIGSNAGNVLTLSNIGGGPGTHVIQMTSSVVNSQVIAAPLAFVAPSSTNGIFGFVNNATSSSATLTLSGTVTNAVARPAIVMLDGSNTGANAITGNISFTAATQGTPYLIKRGAGTWILSGTNVFTGTPMTDTGGNYGVQVLDGVLSLRNNAALGTSGTANQFQVWIGNKSSTYTYNGALTNTFTSALGGGTLELASGITLDNGLSLNLSNGGTIRSNGTNATNGRINVGTSASTFVTLATVGAGDVFSIGNGTNDLTGGAADSVINIAGPGTVFQSVASNYAGNWSINGGTLKLGSGTALGATTSVVNFGASSTGKLQLNGNSVTIGGLGSNATPGSPVVENGLAGAAVLTVNATGSTAYAGVIQNGVAGTLALTKSGAGTLSLSGANTYSGETIVNGGVLRVNNASGTSATGSAAVAVNSTGTLGGAGFISGAVTVNSGGIVAPGNSVGTLTVGGLNLGSGSILNYEFNSSPANDFVNVTVTGGLTINGGGFNLYDEGTTNAFSTAGNYNLIGYTGAIGGTGASALSVLNPQPGKNYVFGANGTNVTLGVTLAGVISNWNVDASGSWNAAGNWSAAIPNGIGETANFSTALTAVRTVTLDGGKTLGGISFDSGASPLGYVIAAGSGGTLSLNNGVNQANIIGTTGAHVISSAVSLDSTNTVAAIAAGSSLTISGSIGGNGNFVKSGAGSVDLANTANTFAGNTSVSGGTLGFAGLASLGAGNLSIDGGTLRYDAGNTADVSVKTVTVGPIGAIIDTNGNDVTFANAIGNGGTGALTKAGSGTLALQGANTYTGATSVLGGILSLATNGSLGDQVAGAGLTLNGGTLRNTATLALDNVGANNRAVTIGAGGGVIQTDDATNLTISGTLGGAGALVKTDTGTLTLAGSNGASFSGAVSINGGTLQLGGAQANGQQALGSGAVSFNGGTLRLNGAGAANNGTSFGNLTNALSVAAGQTGTLVVPINATVSSVLTGGGTFNVGVDGNRQDYQGNWSAFTGQINLTGVGEFRIANFQNQVFNTAKLNIGAGVYVYQNFNPPAGTGTETVQAIGELSGAAGAILGGNPVGGRFVNWTVGGLNTDSTFSGVIQNDTDPSNGLGEAKLTKVGSGTLILAGNNTYTGATTISGGTLLVNGSLGATAVTINGGTLGGTGTIGGAVTVGVGGLVSPGASIGVQSLSSLVLNGTLLTEYDGAGAGAIDRLLVAGAFDITNATVNFDQLGAGLDDSAYVFASYGSLTGGQFANVTDLPTGYSIDYAYNNGITSNNIALVAIPEPSAALLGALGLLALARRKR